MSFDVISIGVKLHVAGWTVIEKMQTAIDCFSLEGFDRDAVGSEVELDDKNGLEALRSVVSHVSFPIIRLD